MAKTLSERLAAHAHSQNRSVVIALREEIQQAINDGWPVKAIWSLLQEEGKISIGYHAFNKQVNRLIKSTSSPSETLPLEPKSPIVKKDKPVTGKDSNGFTFNSSPKKEDLL